MTPQDPDKEESGPVIPDKKLLKTVKKLLYKFEKMEYSSSIFFLRSNKTYEQLSLRKNEFHMM